jgi:hypothetical protein
MSHNFQIAEARMKKSNDLSRSLAPFEPDTSLVVVVELSQSSWLSAPMTKADADGLRLLPNRALSSLQGFCDFSGRGF